MNSGVQLGLLAAVLVAPTGMWAQATPAEALLVLAKGDKMLSIVDPASLKVVARIPVGEDPHEVIASADGRTAYVSNYGFGAYHTLAVVDLVGQKALPAIDLGALRGPHGLTFAGGRTWFTAEGAKAFGSYDPATGKVDLVLGTGQDRTHMIYVSPDGKGIVTTNVSSGTVSVWEKVVRQGGGPGGPPPPGPRRPGSGGEHGPQNGPPPGPPPGMAGGDWEQTLVKVGNGSEGFDVLPDGSTAWVGNAQDGTVSVVDLRAKTVTATLPLEVEGVNRLKFTLDGRTALIAGRGGLTVADVATRKVVKRIEVGDGAAGIVMEPGGKRAFVACSPNGYVAVVDLGSMTMTGKIAIGEDPDGEAWAVRR